MRRRQGRGSESASLCQSLAGSGKHSEALCCQVQVVSAFRDFVGEFKLAGEENALYPQQLRHCWDQQKQKDKGIKFPIEGRHVHAFSKWLYEQLVNYPTEACSMRHVLAMHLEASPAVDLVLSERGRADL